MIFLYKAAQNLVAEHYETNFDLTFRLKTDQNLVVEHYEWDFYMIFHFKEAATLGCRALWKILTRFLHFMVAQNVVAEHYGSGWVTGLTPMTMNKNRFNLVDSILDNITRKKARR